MTVGASLAQDDGVVRWCARDDVGGCAEACRLKISGATYVYKV